VNQRGKTGGWDGKGLPDHQTGQGRKELAGKGKEVSRTISGGEKVSRGWSKGKKKVKKTIKGRTTGSGGGRNRHGSEGRRMQEKGKTTVFDEKTS